MKKAEDPGFVFEIHIFCFNFFLRKESAWTGNFNHLLDHFMKKLALFGICCVIIHFLSLSSAYDQTAASKEAEVMGNSGAGHIEHC